MAACVAAALAIVSCTDKAVISGVLKDAPEKQVVVRELDMDKYVVLDTLTTGKDGSFKYKADIAKGQPEFIYLFYGQTKVASLLLESGEKACVEADTLGNYSVSGSEASAKLQQIDERYADFITSFIAAEGNRAEMTRLYVDYYRSCVKYVMENPTSMTVVPVLFQDLSEYTPIFSSQTDAIFFRQAADTLRTIYPDSKYVKALDREANRRMNILGINNRISEASESGYPDINMPDINGKMKSLSSVDAKVVLVHFWSTADPLNTMFNIEKLMPVYEQYHGKGLEIYSICIDPDKGEWGSVVTAQKLPWINVNDGLGTASPVVSLYNIAGLPTSFIIADGDMLPSAVNSVDGLKRELDRLLK